MPQIYGVHKTTDNVLIPNGGTWAITVWLWGINDSLQGCINKIVAGSHIEVFEDYKTVTFAVTSMSITALKING